MLSKVEGNRGETSPVGQLRNINFAKHVSRSQNMTSFWDAANCCAQRQLCIGCGNTAWYYQTYIWARKSPRLIALPSWTCTRCRNRTRPYSQHQQRATLTEMLTSQVLSVFTLSGSSSWTMVGLSGAEEYSWPLLGADNLHKATWSRLRLKDSQISRSTVLALLVMVKPWAWEPSADKAYIGLGILKTSIIKQGMAILRNVVGSIWTHTKKFWDEFGWSGNKF